MNPNENEPPADEDIDPANEDEDDEKMQTAPETMDVDTGTAPDAQSMHHNSTPNTPPDNTLQWPKVGGKPLSETMTAGLLCIKPFNFKCFNYNFITKCFTRYIVFFINV